METGGLSPIEIGVWLVILLLTLLLGVYVLAMLWRTKTMENLKQIMVQLRASQTINGQVKASFQGYTPADPAPYGRISTQVARQLDSLDEKIRGFYNQYGQIQADIRNLAPQGVRSILRMPQGWYDLWKRSAALQNNLEGLSGGLQAAAVQIKKLENQAWEVARQLRLTLQNDQHALNILEGLQSRSIQGTSLENAIGKGREWEVVLSSRVPVYFLSGDEQEVLSHADKDTVIQVFNTLSKARPSIDRTHAKAREWENQVVQLEQALGELITGFQELSGRFKVLEENPVRPLDWDLSAKSLTDLYDKIELLGPVKKPRTLEEVQSDLRAALDLITAQIGLGDQCGSVEQAHTELLQALAMPEIQEGLEWCRTTQKLPDQVDGYNPENWPRTDGVIKLRVDLQALADLQERLVVEAHQPSGEPIPIQESELERTLQDAKQLVQLHQSLRPRVARIQTRLTEIQTAESEARDSLTKSRALLNQAEMVISSNPFFSKDTLSEAKQIRAGMEKLIKQLDQHDRGAVDAKLQKVQGLITKAGQACNQWLQLLSDELDAKTASLSDKFARLNAIAPLDDPAFVEAQSLLPSQGQRPARQEKSKSKSELPLSEAVSELKRKNEEWQRCVGYLKAIETVEGSVLDSFEKAQGQRQKAREQLAKALEVIPESRSWPPTMQSMAGERGELDKIERDWAALAQQPIQPIRLVSRLGGLAGDYQGLASRIGQKGERAGQEQNRIREVENRLSESSGLWQYQMQLNAENFLARDEIHLLLDEVEKEHEDIKQRFKRGTISYNQALQSVRMLCQKLDSAQIPLDNTRLLDINGEIQKKF